MLALDRRAYERLACTRDLRVIEGAGHLFDESGEVETVAGIAADWFERYLAPVKGACQQEGAGWFRNAHDPLTLTNTVRNEAATVPVEPLIGAAVTEIGAPTPPSTTSSNDCGA